MKKVKPTAKKEAKKASDCCCNTSKDSCKGFGYFLGVLGAAVYYLSTASGFWMGVLGLLKALVWPAFLVFEVLKFIGA